MNRHGLDREPDREQLGPKRREPRFGLVQIVAAASIWESTCLAVSGSRRLAALSWRRRQSSRPAFTYARQPCLPVTRSSVIRNSMTSSRLNAGELRFGLGGQVPGSACRRG